MQVSEQEWISKRAYTLWEKDGREHGKDSEHWEQAKREYALLETSVATKPATRKKAAAKTVATEEVSAKPKKAAAKTPKK